MTLKNAELKALKRSVKESKLDLQALLEEHDRYALSGTDEEAKAWFHSLPIESLNDSLVKDYKLPRNKYSLKDMVTKFSLRKACEKKQEEYESKKSELNIANIDFLIEKIGKISNG